MPEESSPMPPKLNRYQTQIWGSRLFSKLPRQRAVNNSQQNELSSELKFLIDKYFTLSEEKRRFLAEFIKEEFDDQRLHHHFMRLVCINNLQYLSHKKNISHLLVNYPTADIGTFIEWYNDSGCYVVLTRETSEKLKEKIKAEKDGFAKEHLLFLQYQQDGLSAQETKDILISVISPLNIRHAFHLYNKYGLDFDYHLYSRRGTQWLFMRLFREPFNIMGLLTTILIGYKVATGNFNQIGINQTEDRIELLLFVFALMVKLFYDYHDKFQGYQDYSARFGHWFRRLLKVGNHLIHFRNPHIQIRSLIEPFSYNVTVSLNFLALLLLLTPLRKFEEDFFEHLHIQADQDLFPRILKPFVFIATTISLIINIVRALREGCFPCRECTKELAYENASDIESGRHYSPLPGDERKLVEEDNQSQDDEKHNGSSSLVELTQMRPRVLSRAALLASASLSSSLHRQSAQLGSADRALSPPPRPLAPSPRLLSAHQAHVVSPEHGFFRYPASPSAARAHSGLLRLGQDDVASQPASPSRPTLQIPPHEDDLEGGDLSHISPPLAPTHAAQHRITEESSPRASR